MKKYACLAVWLAIVSVQYVQAEVPFIDIREQGYPDSAVFTPDRTKIAVLPYPSRGIPLILIGDADTGRLLRTLRGPNIELFDNTSAYFFSTAIFSPDGNRILVLGELNVMDWAMLDISDLSMRERMYHNRSMRNQGRQYRLAEIEASALVWNLDTGKRWVLQGHGGAKEAEVTVFSPDGKKVIMTRNDGSTRIWTLE